jgi:3-oxoadipate enol-lactonase
MPLIAINGIQLYYESCGAGPPLLLIHGLGSSADDWAFQQPDFAAHFHLILPDLRGSGRSDKPRGAYSIQQFADDFWSLLDKLHVAEITIVGFSLGGAVALQMAVDQSHRVHALVLVNSLPSYRINHWKKWLEAKLQIGLVRTLGVRRTAALVAKRMFPHEHQVPMRERVVSVVGANPRRAYLATIKALIGWSAAEHLSRIMCPALIVAAEHDYTPLAEKHEYAARLPNGRISVFAGSRHGTPFDAREEFNIRVLAFLQECHTLEGAPVAVAQGVSAAISD